jgi:hypothetical protein
MTLDEAKDTLADMARFIKECAVGGFTDKDMQALDIALWLTKAWPFVEKIKATTNLHAEALSVLALQEWEELNPPPFIR